MSALASFLLVGACMAGEDSAKVQLADDPVNPPGDPGAGDTGGGDTGVAPPGLDLNTRFVVTKLTADHPGEARFLEPQLKDVWGVASLQERFWAAAQDTGRLIALKPTGEPTGTQIKLDRGITEIAVNESEDMQMDLGGKCGRVQVLVASQTGRLWAVSSDISTTTGVVVLNRSSIGAQYTGVTIAQQTTTSGNLRQMVILADFHNARIEVLNERFRPIQGMSGKFMLTDLPKNFAPFGLMALDDRVIVTFAERRAPVDGEQFDQQTPGDGKGIVAAFDLTGKLIWSTKSDMLNVPWGMAMGDLRLCATGALLVGQHGNAEKFDGPGNRFGGAIIAMDPRTGKVIGALKDGGNQPVRVQGLWGLTFPTDISDIDQDLLHLGSGAITRDGPKGQERVQHGLFARLDPRGQQQPPQDP